MGGSTVAGVLYCKIRAMRVLAWLIAMGLAGSLLPVVWGQERVGAGPKRRAMLLINSGYQKMPKLPAGEAAVARLKKALERSNFQVDVVRDLTHEAYAVQEERFLASLQPGETCLFYFAGYAIQAEERNYLLPVDFDPAGTGDLRRRGRSMTGLIQAVEQKKAGLKILMLETANQSPEMPVSATQPGLALPDTTESQEIVLAFATALNALPGEVAENEQFLLTTSVAEEVERPGATVEEVFTGARRKIARTGGKPAPFYLSNALEPFLFTPKPPPPPVKPVPVAAPVDSFILRTHVNPKERQDYAYLPPGSFLMGCVAGDTNCEEREKPQHRVTLSKGFWMGVNEVQAEAYLRYVEDDKKTRKMPPGPIRDKNWKDASVPVAEVSWQQAVDYCRWAGGRLPTEAEWEYAARGGKENEAFPHNGENSRERANFYGTKGNDRYDAAAPARKFDPNGFGLFDLAGNLWEWTADYYSETYFQTSPERDPQGPESGKERVVRGGSFDSKAEEHLRISYRKGFGKGGNLIGFRCVLPDSPEVRSLLR
jgi:formylglycine-generating enzyme